MLIPENFKFTDNSDVNEYAVTRAELIFGNDWKKRDDLALSPPDGSVVKIADNLPGGWVLRVARTSSRPDHYIITCIKNGKLEDPYDNIASVLKFHSNGMLLHQSHYSAGRQINPPNGAPSQTIFRETGEVASYWYKSYDPHSLNIRVKKEEVTKRMSEAKHAVLQSMCSGGEDVVALQSGNSAKRPSGAAARHTVLDSLV